MSGCDVEITDLTFARSCQRCKSSMWPLRPSASRTLIAPTPPAQLCLLPAPAQLCLPPPRPSISPDLLDSRPSASITLLAASVSPAFSCCVARARALPNAKKGRVGEPDSRRRLIVGETLALMAVRGGHRLSLHRAHGSQHVHTCVRICILARVCMYCV